MANDDDPIIYACLGFGAGIFFFFNGFKLLKRKRLMENTPTSNVRSLAMGFCEIYGEAKTGIDGVLKSPFSGEDCLYFSYKIEEYRRSGKRSRWVTINKGSDYVPFMLDDDTGMVLVNPGQAEFDIPTDNVFSSSTGKDAPLAITSFLQKKGLAATGLLGWNKTMRYTESFIRPGEWLYILGTAKDNPRVDEATAVHGHLDVMITCDKNNLFYISDKSEKSCIGDHVWSIFFRIWGGAGLTILCLAYILFRAGLFD